jgi:hypothetical protein
MWELGGVVAKKGLALGNWKHIFGGAFFFLSMLLR